MKSEIKSEFSKNGINITDQAVEMISKMKETECVIKNLIEQMKVRKPTIAAMDVLNYQIKGNINVSVVGGLR